ncbi:MAG: FimV/HubP family polar landmark protein [Polynucleobacter victoriensis]
MFLSRYLVSLALAVFAGQALALNLGNLSIQSKVGEPLVAQIAVQVNPSEIDALKDIQAALASPEMYQRLGITSSATQAQLRVSLVKGSKQEPVAIKISSDEVLKLAPNEVFLDALVELRWSAGLVRRVYTLMVADQAKVEVKSGETLTEIATKVMADFDDANLDQALIALYRANPQAFAGGSIHRLMAGSELKIPSKAMVQSVPKQEAREIAVTANTAYRSGQANLPLTDISKPELAGDRLKVGPAAGLEGEAKRRMEELLVQEKALSDAKQRIVELEKNISDLKKLIQSSDQASGVKAPADWKDYAGSGVLAVFILIALWVLLKLSRNEAAKAKAADSAAVPEHTAKLFASLDLNLDAKPAQTQVPSFADLPTPETLRVKLNLIRAYITIEDFLAARQAIDEVLAVSSQVDPDLTIQANSLLAEINQRTS